MMGLWLIKRNLKRVICEGEGVLVIVFFKPLVRSLRSRFSNLFQNLTSLFQWVVLKFFGCFLVIKIGTFLIKVEMLSWAKFFSVSSCWLCVFPSTINMSLVRKDRLSSEQLLIRGKGIWQDNLEFLKKVWTHLFCRFF